MPKPPKISVLIPTSRKDDLKKCLASIQKQTFRDYEILTDDTDGSLSKIRNSLARRAKGKIIVFIDDDVRLTTDWLRSILQAFDQDKNRAGISGPSTILREIRSNRDIFKFRFFKWIYDSFFCSGRANLPGHITESGAWTTGAVDSNCGYEGEVDFLEACNMAFRTDVFLKAGGFDECYEGVGEWSEPDLCFKIRRMGYTLWFSQGVKLFHYPSKSGAFKKRGEQCEQRLKNYYTFLERWTKPHWKRMLFKLWLRVYFVVKAS